MHDQVDRERQAGAAYHRGHLPLLPLRPRHARHAVAAYIVDILEADLDVVEAGFRQGVNPHLIERHARRNQIGVQSRGHGVSDQIHEVLTSRRFAAGEMHLQRPCLGRLGQHVPPFRRRQFPRRPREMCRIRAIRALQRAPMGQFRENSQRWFDRIRCPRHRLQFVPPVVVSGSRLLQSGPVQPNTGDACHPGEAIPVISKPTRRSAAHGVAGKSLMADIAFRPDIPVGYSQRPGRILWRANEGSINNVLAQTDCHPYRCWLRNQRLRLRGRLTTAMVVPGRRGSPRVSRWPPTREHR